MSDLLKIEFDDRQLQRALSLLGEKAADGRVPMTRFYLGFVARVKRALGQVRATGGMFRGVPFARFADQYVRKTDGQIVPAWGGVPRLSKKQGGKGGFIKAKKWSDTQRRGVSTGERQAKVGGNVSGRLRKRGGRVTQNTPQMNDSGELLRRLYPPRPDVTKTHLVIGADAPDYYEHLHKERPVNRFTDKDQREFNLEGEKYLREIAKEAGLA